MNLRGQVKGAAHDAALRSALMAELNAHQANSAKYFSHRSKMYEKVDQLREQGIFTHDLISCDFVANPRIPFTTAGAAFYKRIRGVRCYMITSRLLRRNFYYMYDETMGAKGGDEVAAIVRYVTTKDFNLNIYLTFPPASPSPPPRPSSFLSLSSGYS